MHTDQNLAQTAVIVLGDLQDGIIETAKTTAAERIAESAAALVRVAALYGVPVVVTTVPIGAGTLALPLAEALRAAPRHQRTTTNALDNAAFRQAINATQRRVLLIGGVATEIVVERLALAALHDGYRVGVVVDICGGFGERSEQASLSRIMRVGGYLTSVPSIIGEIAGNLTQPESRQALEILVALGNS